MKSEDHLPQNPTQDRAELREELLRSGAQDQLRVFDALNRESDEAEAVPEMPEELRDRLVEQFGPSPREQPAPAKVAPARAPVADATPSLLDRIAALFKTRPLPSFGGLAVAACAVMFAFIQINGGEDPERVDQLRGGGTAPASTADVPIFLYPASQADGVISMMAQGREVVRCADVSEYREKSAGREWAVAVDLEAGLLSTIESGEAGDPQEIGGDSPRDVLLAIRSALDKMLAGRQDR